MKHLVLLCLIWLIDVGSGPQMSSAQGDANPNSALPANLKLFVGGA